MSETTIKLRLVGNPLPSDDELKDILNATSMRIRRKGDHRTKTIKQSIDVCILELFNYEFNGYIDNKNTSDEIQAKLISVAHRISSIAPTLASLDREKYRVDFYVSTIREEDQGGLIFPTELVAAAANAGASMHISILVLFEEDE